MRRGGDGDKEQHLLSEVVRVAQRKWRLENACGPRERGYRASRVRSKPHRVQRFGYQGTAMSPSTPPRCSLRTAMRHLHLRHRILPIMIAKVSTLTPTRIRIQGLSTRVITHAQNEKWTGIIKRRMIAFFLGLTSRPSLYQFRTVASCATAFFSCNTRTRSARVVCYRLQGFRR